tara:strand:- start:10027 stop:10536 length:510 start_codon:yes stop_codon:yes gene_type:complete
MQYNAALMNESTQAPNLEPATLWRRLAAILYDSIIIIAIWIVVGFVVLSAFGIDQAQVVQNERVQMDPLYRLTLFCSMILSAYLFFAWFWTHSGQTLGMQAWKLRVQNADASAISYKQSLIRFVLAPCSFLLLGAGYFYVFFNPQKQTFHDKMSHSIVTKISWETKPLS